MIIGGSKKEVIENIKLNLENNDLNKKVEINDAVLTDEEVNKYITKFYKHKQKKYYNMRKKTANATVKAVAKEIYPSINITGLENLDNLDLSHGAIITSNHFNPLDSLNVKKVVEEILKKELYIVIQDTNLAMPGNLGFLMNYLNMIPIAKSTSYISKTFIPELKRVTSNGDIVLIYPEEEMWFNYKQPRPGKRGAYQFAAELNIPIISLFVTMEELQIADNDEFNKLKYTVHILKTLQPDETKSPRTNSIELSQIDYQQKVEAYEKTYNKKVNYTFSYDDIAGYKKKD